jgi:hypothetical protein
MRWWSMPRTKRRRGSTGITGLRHFRAGRRGCFCRWRRRGGWWRGERL